jgi:hypothetical protein
MIAASLAMMMVSGPLLLASLAVGLGASYLDSRRRR